MFSLFVILALIVLIIWFSPKSVCNRPAAQLKTPEKFSAPVAPVAESNKKQVRFSPDVKVVPVSGGKSERFNPDLRDCVSRNTKQAMAAGGSKALARLELSR